MSSIPHYDSKKHNAYKKEWVKNNPEKQASYKRNWEARHPEYRRVGSWKAAGIHFSWSQFLELLHTQDYRCKICGTGINTSAHLDHDHMTMKIRGVLCGECNKAIGLFRDSVTTLESALNYLKENA